MKIDELRKNWDTWGREDPLYAILTDPAKRRNKWDESEFFASGRREVDAVMAYLDSIGVAAQRGRALDFGCGVGRLTQALGTVFDRACGVDIAESMIRRAEQYNRHGERCEYRVNTRPDLSIFPDASFDFIYSNIVLQHVPPEISTSYIAEFVRVLAPGGVAVFQIPSDRLELPKAARPGLKSRLIPLAGRLRRALTFWRTVPRIDMYAVPEPQVREIVAAGGANVVDIRETNDAGPDWRSVRYCVRK